MSIYEKPKLHTHQGDKAHIVSAPLKEGTRLKFKEKNRYSFRDKANSETWIKGRLEYRNWLESQGPYPLYAGIRYGKEEHEWEVILDDTIFELD